MNLKNKIKSIHPMYYISFFLPLIIMLIIFFVRDIFPFGERCYLRSDMYHQYCPFFTELWDKLRNGGSLFYSWDIGLGSNFLALYGYYLSSPLNWFIGLFPRKYIIEMMNIIILIKLSLSAVTFTYYISNHFKVKNITISIFAIFYALSGFTAAFSWNLMWFDCVVLVPLVILGLERLINEDKGILYTVSLGLLILSNYYIAIMVCISLVLYFLVLLISMPVPEKKIIYMQKIGYFAMFSLLAGGLSALILIPEVYALGLTASSGVNFPKKLTQYFSLVTVISRHLANIEVCIGLEHLPNIYCGVAVFLLFPLYVFNKKINSREKIAKCVLLVIFLLAFNLNIPNFIWHGLHFPNSLPCRQSFIYVLILLTMCYEAFRDLKEYSYSQLTKTFGIALVFILWLDHTAEETPDFKQLYISALFIALYMLIIYLYKKSKIRIYFIVFLLFCVGTIECAMNMEETGYSTTSRTSYFKDYEDIKELVNTVEENDDSFYRMAKAFGYRTKNDSAWHDFKGGSVFSSTAYEGLTDLYGALGLEHSMNSYADHGSTALVYSMLNMKYLISKKELPGDPLIELSAKVGSQYLYECKYTLPLGYLVSEDINELWAYELDNPFEVQNDFIELNTGVKDVFTPVDFTDNGDKGISIKPETTQHLYVHFQNTSVKVAKATIDGEKETFKGINHGRTIDLGVCEAGVSITVADNEGEDEAKALVYTINEDKFIEAFNILNKNTFEVTDYTDTKVKGTATLNKSGTLMTTIPYDPSWTVKVNGKKVEIKEVAEAFIGIELEAGEYEISLSFTPRGLVPGILITLVSLLILAAVCVYYRKNPPQPYAKAVNNSNLDNVIEAPDNTKPENNSADNSVSEYNDNEQNETDAKVPAKKNANSDNKQSSIKSNYKSKKRK